MPERFEASCVVEVWAQSEGSGMVGSGYVLGSGLVLTAGHVVDRGDRGSDVRRLGTENWLPAERVWRGQDCDAALLRVSDTVGGEKPSDQLGRLGTDRRSSCRAVGFPFAQVKRERGVRDTEELVGEIAPLTAVKEELLTVHISGSVPAADRLGHSPWEGMSGAALFSGPLIVGVVVVAPAHFGTDRLEAVSIAAMAAEPGFREALTGDPNGQLALKAVEDVEIVRDLILEPYRPLPPKATAEVLRRSATHFLVAAEYGIVPFHGRSEELVELEQWRSGGPGMKIGLLVGPAGTGKTRLAAEACSGATLDGDLAGFLVQQAPAAAMRGLAAATTPTLVVVDEAHARVDEVAALMTALADAPSEPPVRVLLLARQVGEWWEQLLPLRLSSAPNASFALSTTMVVQLGPVDSDTASRERAYSSAADAFAQRMNIPVGEPAVPDLRQGTFEQILFVHLAALSGLDAERDAPGRAVKPDLLRFALERESRYWAETAAGAGLDLQITLLERAVAVAILTFAYSEDEAANALKAVPDLVDASQERRRAVARWLRDLYPMPETQTPSGEAGSSLWFRPLTPVPLGEALVARVLETAPALPTELFAVTNGAQAKWTLAVLNQAARSHPSAESALRSALSKHMQAIWQIAVEVAQTMGEPLGRLLAEVLEAQPIPEFAAQIAGAVPTRTVVLRELAVVATRQALEAVQQESAQENVLGQQGKEALLLDGLSTRLSDLGRPEPALEASQQAVDLCRKLAQERPDVFQPQLAGCLDNLSSHLGALGRLEPALEAIQEAVDINRELAEERPDDFEPQLAGSIDNLSNCLGAVGSRDAALEATQEAIGMYRGLASAHPEVFLPELALSYNNLYRGLESLGRLEPAIEAIQRTVDIYGELAMARPDAFLPELAGSLNNLSSATAALGRLQPALEPIQQAVDIYRDLAMARPDAFLPELAMSLNNMSNRLNELGRREQALEAIQQAVDIDRELAQAHPEAFLPELARSLNNLSSCLADLARPRAALDASEQAADITRKLAPAHPDAFLPDLAISLNNLSNRLSDLGRRGPAHKAIQETIDIYRELAKAHPDAFIPDLAWSLNNLSTCLGDLGRRRAALKASEEAVTIFRGLANAHPDVFRSRLARSLTTLTVSLEKRHRRRRALETSEQAVDIYRQLAQTHPDAFLPDLAMSLNNLSICLGKLRRREPALEVSQQAVEISRDLAKARPEVFLPDLASSLDNLSICFENLGHRDQAHEVSREAARLSTR